MKKLILITFAIFSAACGGPSWKADGSNWRHPSGISMPAPSALKPGEVDGSTLTFRHSDSATTFAKVVVCANQADAQKLSLDRLETLKKDVEGEPFKRSATPFADAQQALKADKPVIITTIPNVTEATVYKVTIGSKGSGSHWIFYETSYNGRSPEAGDMMQGIVSSVQL